MSLGLTIEGEPWARQLHTARVRLDCAWPEALKARVLRGAVIQEVDRQIGASVRWHGHDDRPAPADRWPEVSYRIRDGRPEVHMVGPEAHASAAWLCANLHALRLPNGQVLEVPGAEVVASSSKVQLLGKRWARYETVTPIFPADVSWARRPRQPGPERVAWAGEYLASSIRELLAAVGLDETGGQHRLHVHVHQVEDAGVSWDRPGRDVHIRRFGFRARWLCNAEMPSGVCLGRHKAEGYGEVMQCPTT